MDEQLCQLIREIVCSEDATPQQKKAMDRLLKLIPRLPGIYNPAEPSIDYQDALNRALEGVSVYQGKISSHNIRRFLQKRNLNLDNVDARVVQQLFVPWFKRILKNKIVEGFREKGNFLSLDVQLPIGDDQKITLGDIQFDPCLSGLEELVDQENKTEMQRIDRELRRYIEEDPGRKLQNCYPKGYPESNCQELVKRRLLKELPDKWKDIAQELNVPYGTVTAHWKRKCQPLLQEISRNLGYQPE